MAAPSNNQEAPAPDATWKQGHDVDAAPRNSLVKKARLWRPAGQVLEAAAATLGRYALRLIDRATGRAFSADELATDENSPLKAAQLREITGTTHTLSSADNGRLLRFTNAAGCAVTLPAIAAGWNCGIIPEGGTVTITAASGVTLNGTDGGASTVNEGYSPATLIELEAGAFGISGNASIVS